MLNKGHGKEGSLLADLACGLMHKLSKAVCQLPVRNEDDRCNTAVSEPPRD